MVSASIEIIDGKIRVNSMSFEGKECTERNYQLQHLKNVLDETLFNFEKEHQRQFIPNKNTVYIIPKE